MRTNEELRNDVMREIKRDVQLGTVSSQIGVASSDGVITLSGSLDTTSKKLAAERIAKRVSGVKAVVSKIKVKQGEFSYLFHFLSIGL